MQKFLLWLIVALLILTGIVLYRRSRSGGGLDVTPDARRQIEKARRR